MITLTADTKKARLSRRAFERVELMDCNPVTRLRNLEKVETSTNVYSILLGFSSLSMSSAAYELL